MKKELENLNGFSAEAGFAVLDIEVNNVFVGVVQIEERATTEKTIYL